MVVIWRSIYILETREGRVLKNSHDRYIEGSQGALNGNRKKVKFNGSPSLKGKKYREICLYFI